MSFNRRRFLAGSAAAGLAGLSAAQNPQTPIDQPRRAPDGENSPVPRRDHRPVTTLDGASLSWKMVDGVKVFHMIAEPVDHEFAPGLKGKCWGYNGRVHGPTIEAVEGETIRIYVTNRLNVPTTVHWHGLILPNGMDGVGGLTQRTIEPGETFRYEFTLKQHGTFMYHAHHDEMTQMAMGMMGMFVVHPALPEAGPPDRDFVYMLSEWALQPGMLRPNVQEMTDFNVLTLNAKAFPGTSPMVVKTGEKVRIRIGNLSGMDHHPIHLHGYSFQITATDGGDVPESARWPETTVLVPTGATRTIEFVADHPGDWAMHCHMTHHVMTQMGHDLPNLTGVDPSPFDRKLAELLPNFHTMGRESMMAGDMADGTIPRNSTPMMGGPGGFGYITMGGMFTVLKVRDELAGDADPGFYSHPDGTLARSATSDELAVDGIEVE